MQNWSSHIGSIAIAVLVLYCIYVGVIASPVQTVDGKQLVPTKSHPVLFERHNDIDHKVVITHVPSGDSITLFESSGELYGDRTPTDDTRLPDHWTVNVHRSVPVVEQRWDVGTYAGVVLGAPIGHHTGPCFDTGIRISPGRLFQTFSPDILIGREAAGFGISVYPPAAVFGHIFQHLGVGCGDVWDYHGGHSHVMPYCSLAIQF